MRQQENEMKLKLAMELQELTELSWELLEDLEKAKQAGDEKEIDRYTRWKSKTIARMRQTKKIAAILFNMHAQDLEDMAFDIAVKNASKQA